MANLSSEQKRNVALVLAVARRKGYSANSKQALAAIETIFTESGARQLHGGDRDSSGAFQQRPSQGWGPAGESIQKDASQFFSHLKGAKGGTAGQLAQSVQRSAFP